MICAPDDGLLSGVGEPNGEDRGIWGDVVEAAGESTVWRMEGAGAILYGERGAWQEEFASRDAQKQMDQSQ